MGNPQIRITDVSLRDGMHAVRHQFSLDDAHAIGSALDKTGVAIVEATHGDGLGGSSVQYGMAKEAEVEYIRAVCEVVKNATVAALLLPGIGTVEDMKRAIEAGIGAIRIATHCTEADISEQHIGEARKLGLHVVGFLMMAHMVPPAKLVEEAKKMESYGAQVVYVVDSAGAMVEQDVRDRISALRSALDPSVEVGFHGHNNMGLSVSNSVAAVREGASRIDCSLAGLGAGAGNTPLEAFAAVCEKVGIETGINLFAAMDAAEDVVRPRMEKPVRIGKASLTMGYAGVYSSFLIHAYRAADQFGVDPRDILVELGKRKVVGGQEDMIVDVAYNLAKRQELTTAKR